MRRGAPVAVVLVLACTAEDASRPSTWPAPQDDAGTTDAEGGLEGSSDTSGEGQGADLDSGDGGETAMETDGSAAGYPDIARVRVPDSWVEVNDGLWHPPFTENGPSPFHEIGHAFYAEHSDDYDFLVVYTQGELEGGYALADTVAYDIAGIGLDASMGWVLPEDAGSDGRLQQINVMNTPQYYAYDPSLADIVVHETAHRWSAFVELPATPEPGWLLDAGMAHWNVHVHTGGPSATGYGEIVDLGDGTFRFDAIRPLRLSPLELYLGGLVPAHEVSGMFWVAGAAGHQPAVSPLSGEPFEQRSYGENVTFSGMRVDFTVDDVIAANGPRLPAFGDAQTHFRFAFVLVCVDVEACPDEDLAIVEAQRLAFAPELATATGRRASAEVSL